MALHSIYVTINCCRFSLESNDMVIHFLWSTMVARDESSHSIGLSLKNHFLKPKTFG